MDRLLRFVPIAVLAAMAAGCSGASPVVSPPTPTPSPSASSSSLAPAALADAINLRADDLPGFTGSPHVVTPTERRDNARVARCSGATPPSKAVADVSSPDFSATPGTASLLVDSEVTVMPSSADVARDVAAIHSGRASACFHRLLGPELAAELGNVRISGLRFHRIASSAPRTVGPFGFALTLTISQGGRSAKLFSDLRGFAVGKAEVALTTFGVRHRFPLGEEQRLLSLLVHRALTAA